MRISIIASDPAQGLLYYPVQLGQAFARRGHSVQLLTWGTREQQSGLRGDAESSGAVVASVDCLARSGLRALLHPSCELRRAIQCFGADVVHAYGPISAFQARSAAGRTVVMVAAMGHGSRCRLPAMAGAWLLNIVADSIVGQCRAEVSRLRSAGATPRKLTCVLNPVDCDAILSAAHLRQGIVLREVRRTLGSRCTRLVGCFANFQVRKRHMMLLRIFESVAHDLEDVGLVLAGDGEQLQACRDFVRGHHLEGRVCFVGRLPVEDSIGLLGDVDFVVHPSVAETFGYSLVEPLLLGKPLIAARAGVAHELEGLPGVEIVDPDDEAAFERELRHILKGGPVAPQQAQPTADWVRRNCDVRVIAERLEQLYSRLLQTD